MAKKNRKTVIHVKKEWCKACSICVEFCPTNVLVIKDGSSYPANIESCTACKMCEIRCPDFAITVEVIE